MTPGQSPTAWEQPQHPPGIWGQAAAPRGPAKHSPLGARTRGSVGTQTSWGAPGTLLDATTLSSAEPWMAFWGGSSSPLTVPMSWGSAKASGSLLLTGLEEDRLSPVPAEGCRSLPGDTSRTAASKREQQRRASSWCPHGPPGSAPTSLSPQPHPMEGLSTVGVQGTARGTQGCGIQHRGEMGTCSRERSSPEGLRDVQWTKRGWGTPSYVGILHHQHPQPPALALCHPTFP